MMGRNDDAMDLLAPLDDRPGPAARISSQRAADMVRAAVERTALAEPVAPRARSRRSAVLVAAAMLLVVGGASAAIYRATVGADDAEPAVPVEPRPPVPAPVSEALPPAPEPEPPAQSPAPVRDRDEPPRPRAPQASDDPEDLLAAANQHRGQRQWRDAARLYDRVQREHADTTAAYVATVASADIHLQHIGKPRRALALYRAAVRARPDGTLAAEAQLGIAEAHRALGDAAAERAALEKLVAAHPDSLLRERAEQRLDELE